MALVLLASFPNSRIKPRPATSIAVTSHVSCAAGVATLIQVADPNRTYLNVRNLDSTVTIYLGYDPTVDASSGMPLVPGQEYDDIATQQNVYIFNPSGSAILVSLDNGVG